MPSRCHSFRITIVIELLGRKERPIQASETFQMLRDFLAGFSLEQFDFHRFTQRLLIVWLAVYAVAFMVSVARPMAFFVISCFDFAPTYYFELLSALRFAGLWLIPTAFLVAAVLLSNRRQFNGS